MPTVKHPMRLNVWISAVVACAALALSPAMAHAETKGGLSFETGFAPAQDLTVWPLDINQGYPWVRGQVGSMKGVFMLDTGTPWGLLLNTARIDLPDTTFVLKAKAGSGQSFDVVRANRIPPVVLNGQSWNGVRGVHAADLGFLEKGTGIGPFLGFIGAHFFAQSVLTLDYARRVAAIQRVHPDTGTPLAGLPPEWAVGTVLATVPYSGDNPAFPLLDGLLGQQPVRVMLDTGNPRATVDAHALAALSSAGLAAPFSHTGADATYSTQPLQIGTVSVPMLDVEASPEPAAAAGQAAPALVKIGFALLNRLGVIWNYPRQTLSFFTHH